MGWAKYHEDNVSRFWRDANTQLRMGRGAQDRPAGKAVAGNDLVELKLLRLRLVENPSDRLAPLAVHSETARLAKPGGSASTVSTPT